MTKRIADAGTFVPAGHWMDWGGVVRLLHKEVAGNQKAWAKEHGISQAYVNDVLRMRKLPGDKITRALGLEKALLWRTPSQFVAERPRKVRRSRKTKP